MLALLVLSTSLAAAPAVPAGLIIKGDVPKPATLTIAQLEALGAAKLSVTEHGKPHEAWGVSLEKVLASLGVDAGPMGPDTPKKDKRSGYRKVLVASASDGFQAVFSSAEIFEAMGPTRVFVVWKVDDKALGDAGPLRLMVQTDKEGSRSLRNLVKIDVVDGSKLAAP